MGLHPGLQPQKPELLQVTSVFIINLKRWKSPGLLQSCFVSNLLILRRLLTLSNAFLSDGTGCSFVD